MTHEIILSAVIDWQNESLTFENFFFDLKVNLKVNFH